MAKFYTEEMRKHTRNQADMLKGSVNRICVTDDIDELSRLLTSAILDLTELYHINKERILEQLYGDKETRKKELEKLSEEIFKNSN